MASVRIHDLAHSKGQIIKINLASGGHKPTVHTDQLMGGNLTSAIKLVACVSPVCDGAPRLYREHDFNMKTFLYVCVVSSAVLSGIYWGS